MARAVNRVRELAGGVVLAEDDRIVFELPLPVAGLVSTRPLPELAAAERQLTAHLRARGYVFHDPFYTLYFSTADFLPAVRLSARGIWDVKRNRVLRASRRLGGRAAR
jgi:adenine deaminase